MSTAPTGPLVVLVGPPGSGKSTVAAILARTWGVAHRDTDDDVERTAGKPVADIFVTDGEPAFRDLERAAVVTAVREHDGVLSLGGGAVLDPDSRRVLADYAEAGGTVVFLDVSLAHAAPRVGFNQSRPLLLGNPRARWQALMNERRAVYEQVATTTVLTDARTPEQVAAEIAADPRTDARVTPAPQEEQ
ncbi:shikimate kinase [Paraoerskovia marina]|uniref:Shikimate kinase n=1 Tax=Paraoerskovia marina TaxID=545619 RepID=A0A1H1SNN2_9CELL|nr:shikimate kinase [Paraoerskovia marina]SDS49604.1 shikimate kinase [Paraoerskovia marina]